MDDQKNKKALISGSGVYGIVRKRSKNEDSRERSNPQEELEETPLPSKTPSEVKSSKNIRSLRGSFSRKTGQVLGLRDRTSGKILKPTTNKEESHFDPLASDKFKTPPYSDEVKVIITEKAKTDREISQSIPQELYFEETPNLVDKEGFLSDEELAELEKEITEAEDQSPPSLDRVVFPEDNFFHNKKRRTTPLKKDPILLFEKWLNELNESEEE